MDNVSWLFLCIFTFLFLIFSRTHTIFLHEITHRSILIFVVFCTSSIIFYCFTFLFFILCWNIFWLRQISSHSFVYISMLSSSVNLLHHVLCLIVFLAVLILFPTGGFNTYQKVINGVGWRDDCHGPSPVLCDTVTLFVYIDQLFCHCVFIFSNVLWQLVTFLHDGSLYCFCLLAESYETIGQSINQSEMSRLNAQQIFEGGVLYKEKAQMQ